MTRREAILHPVRLRIIKALESGRMTPLHIATHLPDVSQATLYRHINRLLEAGIVEVVERNQVHGTVERVFSLVREQSVLAYEDLVNASGEDMAAFSRAFLAELLGSYERYFRSAFDLKRDQVVFYEQVVYVTPEEAEEARMALRDAVNRYLQNPPGEGRTARTLAVFSVPELEPDRNGRKDHD